MTMAIEQYKLADAKARFSEIVQKAMLGESIVVTKENRPVVKIVAIKDGRGLRPAARRFRGVYVIGAAPRHPRVSVVVRGQPGTLEESSQGDDR
jgi:prevent-host-death family protein